MTVCHGGSEGADAGNEIVSVVVGDRGWCVPDWSIGLEESRVLVFKPVNGGLFGAYLHGDVQDNSGFLKALVQEVEDSGICFLIGVRFVIDGWFLFLTVVCVVSGCR